MSKTYDVCIRGAGIVGRTLALHLAARRLRVALIGQAAGSNSNNNPAHSDVRAYALSPASRALIEAVRCWPTEQHATPVLRMQIQEEAGGRVHFDAAEQGVGALNWIVDVPELERLLSEAVRFQPLIEVLEPQHRPTATLTVVCEGRYSATRNEFGVEFDATPYQQSALAARVTCVCAHAQVARQWFSNSEIVALLPMDGSGGHACAVVWSASPERVQALQAMDADAFCAELQTASQCELGEIALTSERKDWVLQAALARQWCGSTATGSWVLVGDAAHNVHPLAGQGLNLGLADVAELTHILGERAYWRSVSDRRLLRQYERARKADYALIGGAGDALQLLFQNQHPVLQSLRNWGMRGFEQSGRLKQWVAAQAMGRQHSTTHHP